VPAALVPPGVDRPVFALFLATAMSISAMPVIAKILIDLDLTKRNIGLVILSAGVVDDTVGWLILSLIAAAATHGVVRVQDLGLTVAYLAIFIIVTIFVLYPILRVAVRIATEHFKASDSDLVLVIVTTFLCAAATERIGVHPVFGAFVAGIVFHQVPRLRKETIARLESVTFGVLAPIFFGIVGLRVDLWSLGGGGGTMLGVVIAVACVGKLVGCSLGAYWGGLRFWEAASIAVAMNARGAMEIVVATIGLSLGILTPQMFSIIVMVAIVTSFLAPVGLRLTMPRVRITEEEARRILASESTGAFDPTRVRVLLAAGGGENALAAAPLAYGMARKSSASVKIVHVTERRSRWGRLFHRRFAGSATEQVEQLRALSPGGRAPEVAEIGGLSIAGAICEEAKRGCDVIMMGSGDGPSIGGVIVEQVVGEAPCHVAIMKAPVRGADYKRILVPVDGSVASRLAVELALRYAETSGAELALAVLTERRPQAAAYADLSGTHVPAEIRATSDEELQRISIAFRASDIKPNILHLAFDPRSSAIAQEVERGKYDLIVVGAENRAIQHRLFFGYENERLIRGTRIPVVVVVPNLSRLGPNGA
jgi:Kef-type K+ transport system membrane component KefB/nucleotide-binding universal stress UspA family protein